MNLLIVEDDKETLEFLKPSLMAEGFVVDVAEDGEAGSYKGKTNDYDLIILDIGLPRKNGRQVCSEIRSAGKSMPILILSVKGEIETKVDLLSIGADDYITKPFSYVELAARVRALMRRPDKMEDEIFRVDDIELNLPKRSVHRAGKEVHLAPKEFFLLEFLLRNRGRVLTRQTILEHVWDMNADLFTNTVETHVTILRRKLKGKSKDDFIRTVSGTGYVID
ncbi:MAG: response regulator transcription factor [Dehalococcoidales bacterium]|nr:response regulator transcription factor [Dehalococcoidales bacterium]